MNKAACPSCGSGYNGKRCRSCGYESFGETNRSGNRRHTGVFYGADTASEKTIPQKPPSGQRNNTGKKQPMLGFVVLLTLIYSLMPVFRNWGLQLEAMEAKQTLVTPEPVVPAADSLTLYQDEALHIFTTKYDAGHFADNLTLYVQNNSQQDLELFADEVLVNQLTVQQELYCKAGANAIGKTWLKLDKTALKNAGNLPIRSLEFRLSVYSAQGTYLHSTDIIKLGETLNATSNDTPSSEEELYHG